jgi:hypothetical protein
MEHQEQLKTHPYQARPYVPRSMAHPEGHKLVRKHMEKRGLPDITGWLFITCTVDRHRYSSPHEAYEDIKSKLKDGIKKLRYHGYKCKRWIRALEFHEDDEGWPHWHWVIDERRFIPWQLLNKCFPWGYTDIERIRDGSEVLHYVFKYITKSGTLPGWILDNYKRLRFIQTSGVFEKVEDPEVELEDEGKMPDGEPLQEPILREKIKRWNMKVTVVREMGEGKKPIVRVLKLRCSYMEMWLIMRAIEDYPVYHENIYMETPQWLGEFLEEEQDVSLGQATYLLTPTGRLERITDE